MSECHLAPGRCAAHYTNTPRNTVRAPHYRNTPVHPHYRPIYPQLYYWQVCVLCIVLCILARPPVGNRERIYNHPTGKGRQKSADIGEISQPWCRERNSCHFGEKLLILLKFMNIWNCAWQNRRARVSMCGNLRLGHISRDSSQIDRGSSSRILLRLPLKVPRHWHFDACL